MGHLQRGYVYEASGFFYVRYNVTEIVDGEPKRVQRSHKLVEVGASVPQEEGGGTYYMKDRKPCKALKLLRDKFMLEINQGQQSTRRDLQHDMPISEFWEHRYLPYCEEVLGLTGQPR